MQITAVDKNSVANFRNNAIEKRMVTTKINEITAQKFPVIHFVLVTVGFSDSVKFFQ